MGDIRTRLASLSLSTSLLVVLGVLGGCGDNAPKASVAGTGGAGMAGSGGGGASGGSGGQPGLGGSGGSGGLGGGTGGGAGIGGGGGAATPCYATTFATPAANNATLTVADDVDHTCADGFTYIVNINSSAPDGTVVSLYSGSNLLQAATVMSGAASFSVKLASGSTPQSLAIQYPDTATCDVTRTVTVNCSDNAPNCTLSQPVISATHPALNGVPVASGGDRVSSAGSSYQVTFKVQTSAEDGQPVTLAIDNPGPPVTALPPLNTTASNGVATFTATLPGDGTYEAVATCINKNGVTGTSAKGTYPVDTSAPDLTVNSPTSGQFAVGASVNVCGQTSSADAAGLPASLGAAQSNLCVTVGSSATPSCTPVATVNTSTCVAIPCPGAGAFDYTLTLKDKAGNPTSQTVTGVTCASSLPAVQIIAPASDAPTFTDKTKHILAAGAPTGVKDLDANTAGAQVNVVACTDTAGTAVLKVGHKGDATLTQLGGSVATAAAVAGDNCPAGLSNVVKFSGVTIPESAENADGSLSAPTELTVTVTSSANTQAVGTSQPDDVWVDTVVPAVAVSSPAALCGSFAQSSTTVTQDLAFTADDKLVVLDVDNGSVTTTYDTPAYLNGVATFPNVALAPGQNDITVAASDPAGNAVQLSPNPCSVTVGAAPVVTFTTPTSGALLCPAGATVSGCVDDTDTGTAGWQGSLAVTVTAGGVAVTSGDAVTFSIGATTLGTANLDGSGHAQLDGVTVPEGVQTIVATTASIAGAGIGTGSTTVTVDTTPPSAPTGLMVSVADRRKTSMQLTWTAPTDGNGSSVTGYQIRYATVPIDSSNFDSASVTTAYAYTGKPSSPGQVDGITITPLYIENTYYFAVKAVDVAGSASSMLATPSGGSCTCNGNCCAAHFLATTLTGASGDRLGRDIDGSGDFGRPAGSSFTGDGISDLLVGGQGNNRRVFLYFGSATGYPASPSVTFTGTATGFGSGVANIADVDGDGLQDIAIAARNDGLGKVYIYSRKNPPASWGTTGSWPAALNDTDANYVITATAPLTANSMDIHSLARLGNFDGTGSDDFAVAFDAANSITGAVFVVKGSSSFASINLPDATNAYEIDGAAPTTGFGGIIMGLGPFYSPTAGPGLVATSVVNWNVYAFAGQTPAGTITAAAASDSAGTVSTDRYGGSLGLLGPIGTSPDALTVGALGGKYVDVYFGTSATGPIVGAAGGAPNPSIRFVDPASGNNFGVINIGGAVPGTAQVASLVGADSIPDLVLAGQSESGMPLYLVNGAAMLNMSGTVNVSAVADPTAIIKITGVIPSDWSAYSFGTLIPDSNGDSVPDFAVAESVGATGTGRVIVLY